MFSWPGPAPLPLLVSALAITHAAAINLLDMAEGPGLDSNYVEVQAVQGERGTFHRIINDNVTFESGSNIFLIGIPLGRFYSEFNSFLQDVN